jgi:hypothetical protein
METKTLKIVFVDNIVDQCTARNIWYAGYPHTEADYFWIDTTNNINWIDVGTQNDWKLIHKNEIEKYGYTLESRDFYHKSYAAPTSEQVLIWKLKG